LGKSGEGKGRQDKGVPGKRSERSNANDKPLSQLKKKKLKKKKLEKKKLKKKKLIQNKVKKRKREGKSSKDSTGNRPPGETTPLTPRKEGSPT
jgi:hypothetical protein